MLHYFLNLLHEFLVFREVGYNLIAYLLPQLVLYLFAHHISQLLEQNTIAFTRYQVEGINLESILLLLICSQLLLLRLHLCLQLILFDL